MLRFEGHFHVSISVRIVFVHRSYVGFVVLVFAGYIQYYGIPRSGLFNKVSVQVFSLAYGYAVNSEDQAIPLQAGFVGWAVCKDASDCCTLRPFRKIELFRVFVVEECWSKKFNVPDRIWKWRYDEPKQIHKYYHVKSVFTPEGIPIAVYPTWATQQYVKSVANNPRLRVESHRGRAFYLVNPRTRTRGPFGPGNSLETSPNVPGRSPFGSNAH